MDIKLLELILSSIAQPFLVSQLSANHQEIVDGGTKNRIWSFLSIVGLIPFAFAPIQHLFPLADLSLPLYSLMALSGGIYYIASVAHQNQIHINNGEPDKIESLPYDLHQNEWLMTSALFLSRYMAQFFLSLYIASLVACVFLGAPLYAYLSLTLYGVNWLNQNNYVPLALKTPLLYFNILVLLSTVFGFSSGLYTVLTIGMVGFTVYDFVRCTWFHSDSPTAQFPMADPSHQRQEQSEHDHDHSEEERVQARIAAHLQYKRTLRIGQPGVHVTFNHFYESQRITDRILNQTAPVNYEGYAILFNQMNFQCESLRTHITNEMLGHEKFNQKNLTAHQHALNLPPTTSLIETQIAYLKQEMRYFVDRLTHPSYRDLTPQQVAELHRYARLLLNHIQNPANNDSLEQKNQVLLYLALTTGSHCNRGYLESFTTLASDYPFLINHTLPFREQAILQIQSVREQAFRTYYYETATAMKELSPETVGVMWADLDDYHTYENFVQVFGSNFYLRNPSLNQRIRDITDVFADRMNYYLYDYLEKEAKEKQLINPRSNKPFSLLFSSIYNAAYLIKETANPDGKLHKLFITWCETTYPSCYTTMLYDENYYLRIDGTIEILAELMLLELSVLDLDAPYSIEHAAPEDTINAIPQQRLTRSLSFFSEASQSEEPDAPKSSEASQSEEQDAPESSVSCRMS